MKNKPTIVNNRMPHDPENKTLSKAQFQAKMRAKRELEAKLKAYEKELKQEVKVAVKEEGPINPIKEDIADEPKEVTTQEVFNESAVEETVKEVKKGRGRPKKIE